MTVRASVTNPAAVTSATSSSTSIRASASSTTSAPGDSADAPSVVLDAATPCIGAPPPARYDHVIWIWMENKPYSAIVGSSSAPYENQLAAACGLATNYHAVALPNYRGGFLRAKPLSFRSISGEYFRHEARNEFCMEALAFFAMVVTAAIPILSNMHALADFARATGRF